MIHKRERIKYERQIVYEQLDLHSGIYDDVD